MDRNEIKNLIDSWNQGLPVDLISLGGLGDGYERCIWSAAFEVLVYHLHDDMTEDPAFWSAFGNVALDSADARLGMSGAQYGAAKNAAAVIFRHGYKHALTLAPEDRRIVLDRGSFDKVTDPATPPPPS